MANKDLSYYNPNLDNVIISDYCVIVNETIIYNPQYSADVTKKDIAIALLNAYKITPRLIAYEFDGCNSYRDQLFVYCNDPEVDIKFNIKSIYNIITSGLDIFDKFNSYIRSQVGLELFAFNICYDITNIKKLNKYYIKILKSAESVVLITDSELIQFVKVLNEMDYIYRDNGIIKISKTSFSIFGLTSLGKSNILRISPDTPPEHVSTITKNLSRTIINLLKITGRLENFLNHKLYRNLKNL